MSGGGLRESGGYMEQAVADAASGELLLILLEGIKSGANGFSQLYPVLAAGLKSKL